MAIVEEGRSEAELDALLAADPGKGWRQFIDTYTPTLLALIERADIRDRDEAMEIYVLVCERLSGNQCERLRHRDSGKGSLHGWLAVVVRNVIVDWVRSRAGRRRLFGVVKALPPLDQRVFELYYWDDRLPTDIAVILSQQGQEVSVTAVFDALSRIEEVLTARHRADLLAMAVRSKSPASLNADEAGQTVDAIDPGEDPETRLARVETEQRLEAGLAALPAEDAAIIRLRFMQGLSVRDTARALHLGTLTSQRLSGILARLESAIALRQPAVGEL